MDDIREEAKGKYNQGVGKAKEEVGEATRNPSLEAEGRAQGAKGDFQDIRADTKGETKRKPGE